MIFKDLVFTIARTSGITLVFGLLLYLPIEFIIYYPYFNTSWTSSTCIVKSIQRFHMYSHEITVGNKVYHDYSLFDVQINIDGDWKQSFACGCSDATMILGSKGLNNQFPYQYSLCYESKECGNMYVMPPWYCNECKNCTKYIDKGVQNCKYLLKDKNNLINHANQIPNGYRIPYPTEDSVFIQVIFMDSPYYSEADYLAFQILVLGLMVSLPGFFLVSSLFCIFIFKLRERASVYIHL